MLQNQIERQNEALNLMTEKVQVTESKNAIMAQNVEILYKLNSVC